MQPKKEGDKGYGIAAGITGAVIGAGIVAVAAKIVTDKKNQKIIKDKAADLRTGMTDAAKSAEKQVKNTKEHLQKQLKK